MYIHREFSTWLNYCVRYINIVHLFAPEQTKAELQRDLQSIQSREVHLLSTNQGLERDLETTVGEVGRWQGLLESNKLELSKTRVYSLSLEKKNKVILSLPSDRYKLFVLLCRKHIQ